MSGKQSQQFLDLVEAALPRGGAGMTPKMVHERVGVGARESVRQALSTLIRQGRAKYAGGPGSRLYWWSDSDVD